MANHSAKTPRSIVSPSKLRFCQTPNQRFFSRKRVVGFSFTYCITACDEMMSVRCMKPVSFVSKPGENACTWTIGRQSPVGLREHRLAAPAVERRARRIEVDVRPRRAAGSSATDDCLRRGDGLLRCR